MTDKSPLKVSFDFPGAMRQLGRVTRRAYDTVKDKTGDWDAGAEEDEERKSKGESKPKDRQGK